MGISCTFIRELDYNHKGIKMHGSAFYERMERESFVKEWLC
jgi:hypothetical protein